MNKQYYPLLDETLVRKTLANGLRVVVCPKPGFTWKRAYFVTDFGAMHTHFTLEGQEYTVPAGVAHYLEHKLFELPDRDVSGEFAQMGASVNAFTSYDLTAYYFSCTQRFADCLRLLLEFVSTPYFPQESVERERGIIDQEIAMSADDCGIKVFENLTAGLYHTHPIRVPILGTQESIREITPDILELCHRAFYNPANMILCVVGDVEAEQVCAIAEAVLGNDPKPAGIKEMTQNEPMDCPLKTTHARMDIAMPTFCLGFKCEPTGLGETAIRQEYVADLACEALFGESSQLYLQLYEEGLIDSSFGGGFETSDGCAMVTCGGDSLQAAAVLPRILEAAERIVREGIGNAEFQRMKRSAFGRRIRDLDSFDSTCFRLCAYDLSEYDYFRFPGLYDTITSADVQAFLDRVIRAERSCLAIIEPLEGGITQ